MVLCSLRKDGQPVQVVQSVNISFKILCAFVYEVKQTR